MQNSKPGFNKGGPNGWTSARVLCCQFFIFGHRRNHKRCHEIPTATVRKQWGEKRSRNPSTKRRWRVEVTRQGREEARKITPLRRVRKWTEPESTAAAGERQGEVRQSAGENGSDSGGREKKKPLCYMKLMAVLHESGFPLRWEEKQDKGGRSRQPGNLKNVQGEWRDASTWLADAVNMGGEETRAIWSFSGYWPQSDAAQVPKYCKGQH